MTVLTPKGNLVTLVGFDPDGNILPLQVTADGYIIANYETSGAGTGTMLTPKGNLVQPVAFDPSGNILPIQVTAEGYLRVSLENFSGGDVVMLEDILLAAEAANFTFSNIPQTYKHLKIIGTARSKYNAIGDWIMGQFNGDTGNNYDYCSATFYDANGYVGTGIAGAASGRIATAVGNAAPANKATVFEINIANYAQTVLWKSWITPTFLSGGATNGTQYIYYTGGEWKSTAAITSITMFPASLTNLMIGSRATLYGLK